MTTTALTFKEVTFDVIDRNGDAWLKGHQIGAALGYADEKAVQRIYSRHSDEFTDSMTAVVKLTTPSGEQDTRIFSPRGCYALAMFSRTKVAKAFRVWVLDVLESVRKTGQYTAAPYSVAPGDSLTREQAETLRDMIRSTADKLPKEKQGQFIRCGWSKLMSHFKVSYRLIPQEEFAEALSIIARHCVEYGELLDAEAPAALPDPFAQMKPPTFTVADSNTDPEGKRNVGQVHDILRSLQHWAGEELPRHVRPAFGAALLELDSLIISGWTEVDEAMRELRSAQRATKAAMSYLNRWNEGGGYGIQMIRFMA